MINPTVEELLYHAKQAEENAANLVPLCQLDGEDGAYWRQLYDYHSLSARALTKWVEELKNKS
jgi:hypothetical protein